MIDKKVIKELKTLIEENLDPTMFPYCKGNSIRIGKIIIRESKQLGFVIFDKTNNQKIATTFCKTAAVALAKNLASDKNQKEKILSLDHIIRKNYIDMLHYSHIMNTTKNSVTADVVATRYDLAKARTEDARDSLDFIIFS